MDKLSQEEIDDFRESFNEIDAKKDGYIDKEEVAIYLKNQLDMEPTPTEIDEFFNNIMEGDENNDGKLSFEEYVAWKTK
jgi:Ca2+-binding EF-hand superfamily protein